MPQIQTTTIDHERMSLSRGSHNDLILQWIMIERLQHMYGGSVWRFDINLQ